MKKLILLLSLLIICNISTAQDMYYEKCATMPGLLPGWELKIIQIDYDSANWCHTSNEQYYNGNGLYIGLAYTTTIVNMGPLGAQPDMTGIYFDDCHYHWHLGLIDTRISDLQGNVLVTGAKLGYDWVDSSPYSVTYPSRLLDCRLAAIAQYDPTWVHPNLPPDDNYNSGNLGMTPGYEDTYVNNFDNNWVVIGDIDVNGVYTGLADGDYIFDSKANFDDLLDQGPNNFPDSMRIYINITNGIVTEIDPPVVTVPPIEPANFQVNYKNNLSAEPFVSWVGDADYFELERWVQHGNSNAQANTVNVLGNTFIDSKNDLLSAALILLGTDKGIKFFYKIRAVNSAGASNWILSDIVKL